MNNQNEFDPKELVQAAHEAKSQLLLHAERLIDSLRMTFAAFLKTNGLLSSVSQDAFTR